MNFGIAGRVALVLGGSKGIGLESARMLAAEGCQVAIVARGQRHIDLAVNGIRADGGDAIGVIADMTQRDHVEVGLGDHDLRWAVRGRGLGHRTLRRVQVVG